ncbi:MAG TPA: amidohydrolase family protein [Opitutaceae bacterium]
MPQFPIVDTHVHLWDPARLRYRWLEEVPPLNRRHGLEEFRHACGAVQVAKMVFVECGCDRTQSLDEARWVAELAQSDSRIRGIVAHAPLENGAGAEEAVARLAELPAVRGIRRLLQNERADYCVQPDFVRGVKLLPKYGLSFDLCIKHPQLTHVIALVRQCPEVTFILDHIGKPDIKAGTLDPWRAELGQLAQLDNVWCKLSGLATEADCEAWTANDLRPYISHTLECFGPGRVLFGGDWPVSTLATDYPRWVATVDEALRGCSAEELQRVYVRNAERVYRV